MAEWTIMEFNPQRWPRNKRQIAEPQAPGLKLHRGIYADQNIGDNSFLKGKFMSSTLSLSI